LFAFLKSADCLLFQILWMTWNDNFLMYRLQINMIFHDFDLRHEEGQFKSLEALADAKRALKNTGSEIWGQKMPIFAYDLVGGFRNSHFCWSSLLCLC